MKTPNLSPLLWIAAKALVFSVVVVLVLKYAGPVPVSINTKTLDKDNTFYVTADASVFAKPDLAKITLSVTNQAPTALDAQKKANDIINNVTNELKKMGVPETNIKTTGFNIYPQYGTSSNITGYNANISMEVKDKDLSRVNKIIDKATSLGVNQISGITFEVENKEASIDQARKGAIQQAKAKAAKIAGEAGIRLGRVLNVSEATPTDLPPYFGKGLDATGLGGGGGTEVQPGQTEIKVQVTLSYETL